MCLQDRMMSRYTDTAHNTTASLGAGVTAKLFDPEMRRTLLMVSCLWEVTSIGGGDVVYVYAGDPANSKLIAVLTSTHPVEVMRLEEYGEIITSAIYFKTSAVNTQNMTGAGMSVFTTATDEQLKQLMR